ATAEKPTAPANMLAALLRVPRAAGSEMKTPRVFGRRNDKPIPSTVRRREPADKSTAAILQMDCKSARGRPLPRRCKPVRPFQSIGRLLQTIRAAVLEIAAPPADLAR